MEQNQELIDVATQLYFQTHQDTHNFNTPEVYELEESGYIALAKRQINDTTKETIGSFAVVKSLIPSLLNNIKIKTIRVRQYRLKYYKVYCTSWKHRRCEKCPHCVVEILDVKPLMESEITEEIAGEVGYPNRKAVIEALRKWYPYVNGKYYIHTFQVVE